MVRIGLVLLASVVWSLAACEPEEKTCGVGGHVCPTGWVCDEAAATCIDPAEAHCGNGVDEAGEACDDGNRRDGDGCSADCGSLEVCGDGVLNDYAHAFPPEICDDRNTVGGDGCSADCRSDETCGNGVRDPQETCDDGNKVGGDGCSADCASDETCGNGVGDPGEACDDGNAQDQDDCTTACLANICGDGIQNRSVDDGGVFKEACDERGHATAECNPDCTSAACGDGLVNRAAGEQCDNGAGDAGGTTPESASCDDDCTSAYCGDHTVNGARGEACDDGNNVDGDGCSSSCNSAERCGDGVRNATLSVPEACDAGARCEDGTWCSSDGACAGHGGSCEVRGGFGCSADCHSAEHCGDRYLNDYAHVDVSGKAWPAETCDDGNDRAGDGCGRTCELETGWTCGALGEPCHTVCGDGVVAGVETCDDGARTNGNGCDPNCQLEPGFACKGTVCTTICGDGQIHGAETCDDGNTAPGDGCDAGCALEAGWSCAHDGAHGGACSTVCGDSRRSGFEECDDGAHIDGDGCSVSCRRELGWECPSAGGACHAVCGDFVVRDDETCDDGNLADGDGCNHLCKKEAGFACPAGTKTVGGACQAVCGDSLVRASEACDDGNAKPGDGCDSACQLEPGWRCAVSAGQGGACQPDCGDGVIRGAETCDEGEAAPSGGCVACGLQDGWSCPTTAGVGGLCATTCGDGKVRGAETCDDSNRVARDGCNDACRLEEGWICPSNLGLGGPCATVCGDGKVRGGETCDEGEAAPSGGCVACAAQAGWACLTTGGLGGGCSTVCGDGMVRGHEACDDGNTDADDGCTPQCATEDGWSCPSAAGLGGACRAICGDGQRAGAEACDDANVVAGDGCDSGCQPETGWECASDGPACETVCGDGLVRGTEACDEGDADPSGGCDTCQPRGGWTCPVTFGAGGPFGHPCTPTCGDGVLTGDETCEGAAALASAGCDACHTKPNWVCPADPPPGQACIYVQPWNETETVARANGGSLWAPGLALDAAGRGLAVWSWGGGIYARSYAPDGSWSDIERIVSRPVAVYPLEPSLVALALTMDPASGSAIISWGTMVYDDSIQSSWSTGTFSRMYDPAEGFGPTEALDTAEDLASGQQFVVLGRGSVKGFWTHAGPGGTSPIVTRTYTRATGWSELEEVDSLGGSWLQAVPTGDGGAILSWYELGLPRARIWDPETGWTERLTGNDASHAIQEMRLVATRTGEAMASWMAYDAGAHEYRIYGAEIGPSGWGPISVLRSGSGTRRDIFTAGSADGSAFVGWGEWNPQYDQEVTVRRWTGAAWDEASTLDTGSGAPFPAIATDTQGHAIVTYWNGTPRWASYAPGSGWTATAPIGAGTSQAWTPVAMDQSPGGWSHGLLASTQSAGLGYDLSQVFIMPIAPDTGLGTATSFLGTTGQASAAQVQRDGNRHTLAAWIQGRALVSSTQDANGHWSVPVTVTDTGVAPEDLAFSVQRGPAANGDAVAMWRQWKAAQYSIRASRYGANSGWGTVEEISPTSGANPRVTIDGAGNILAVWASADGVHARRFDGSDWGADHVLTTDQSFWNLDARSNTSGDAVIAWVNSTDYDHVMARVGDPDGSASDDVSGPDNWLMEDSLHVAVGESGVAAVAWYAAMWSEPLQDWSRSVVANVYVPESGWTGPHVFVDHYVYDGWECALGVDAQGHVMVVWTEMSGPFDTAKWSVFASRFDGTSWSEPEAVSSGDGPIPYSNGLSFDMASSGDAVVAWRQADTLGPQVFGGQSAYASQYVPGLGWMPARLLETSDERVSYYLVPTISVDHEGRATVLWGQYMPGTEFVGIYGRTTGE